MASWSCSWPLIAFAYVEFFDRAGKMEGATFTHPCSLRTASGIDEHLWGGAPT
jgi:hypothetical protein